MKTKCGYWQSVVTVWNMAVHLTEEIRLLGNISSGFQEIIINNLKEFKLFFKTFTFHK